jgi:hypothetical protein
VYKFSTALKIRGKADTPQNNDDVLDDTRPDQKAKADARKRNGVAINLTMAFTNESLIGMI